MSIRVTLWLWQTQFLSNLANKHSYSSCGASLLISSSLLTEMLLRPWKQTLMIEPLVVYLQVTSWMADLPSNSALLLRSKSMLIFQRCFNFVQNMQLIFEADFSAKYWNADNILKTMDMVWWLQMNAKFIFDLMECFSPFYIFVACLLFISATFQSRECEFLVFF